MKDWVYIGAHVERPDGFIDKIMSVHEDKGIRLEMGTRYYCRTELKPFVDKPTKTELIDQAIKDLGGDISKVTYYGCEGHIYLRCSNAYAGNYVLSHYNSAAVEYGSYFCTIEEFEQRKKELEQMNDSWYDYENQKALRFPPVGGEVLFRDINVFVVAQHVNRDAVIVSSGYSTGSLSYGISVGDFKPLDWERLSKKNKVIKEILKVIEEYSAGNNNISVASAIEKLYELDCLKLPENKA